MTMEKERPGARNDTLLVQRTDSDKGKQATRMNRRCSELGMEARGEENLVKTRVRKCGTLRGLCGGGAFGKVRAGPLQWSGRYELWWWLVWRLHGLLAQESQGSCLPLLWIFTAHMEWWWGIKKTKNRETEQNEKQKKKKEEKVTELHKLKKRQRKIVNKNESCSQRGGNLFGFAVFFSGQQKRWLTPATETFHLPENNACLSPSPSFLSLRWLLNQFLISPCASLQRLKNIFFNLKVIP